MIETLLSIVKPIDAPGSIPFLLLCLAFGLVVTFVWPRNAKFGRRWLTGVGVLYGVLALPVIAHAIATSLDGAVTSGHGQVGAVDALVVFDGDNRRGRVNATREYFQTASPTVVWVLGLEADWIQGELPLVGIPRDRIRVDRTTGTTREQIRWVTRYRAENPGARLALVVSRLQAPRVHGMAELEGLTGVPVIGAPVDREPAAHGIRLFLPTYAALRVSRDALYEHAALAYYAHNGWVRR